MWVDEAIWGHRLHDEQTPWFVLLEFLGVLASVRDRESLLREPGGYNRLAYTPAHRLYLRNILFNYPVTRLSHLNRPDVGEEEKWRTWSKEMAETQTGLVNPDFSYLRSHFESFADFVEVVRLVQSSCLELQGNKRWTSRFVFPYCEEALYEDLDRDAKTNDRRFFGRAGELLYLMLCRADQRERLARLLEERFICSQETIWHVILKALQPEGELPGRARAGGFLPYATHPCFDALCQDWIAVLELNLPMADAFSHLARLAGLHLLRYQQVCARETLGEGAGSCFVCEIVAPRKTLVREMATESYVSNNSVSARAVLGYVAGITDSDEWRAAEGSPDAFHRCQELLRREVFWPRQPEDYDGPCTAEGLLDTLQDAVQRRHGQHVANVHRVYGREIGLVSRRGTNRLRYAPTDALFRTLVLANVPNRMEFSEFLDRLLVRYGIIVGDAEAVKAPSLRMEDLDKKAFQSNADRLEQRLASIGLLLRLSDGCAYLVNPYMRATE